MRARWLVFGLFCLLVPNTSPAQLNGVLREVYTGIGGVAVSDLTNHPSFPGSAAFDEVLTSGFEAPIDVMDDYGQRMTAYVLPPATGNYVFWISSDDASQLFLATDENPSTKRVIASVEGWTPPREWGWSATQRSASIALTAGRKYYIEALMKEGGGGDNLAVRWQLPNGTIDEPIPNHRLEVFGMSAPIITQQPVSVSVLEGGLASFTVQLARAFGATYQWQRNGTSIPGATNATFQIASVTLSDHNTRYRCAVANPYGNTLSQEATLTVSADVTPPTLNSASTLGDPETVTVLFSEPVEEVSATRASNYSINQGVTVLSARFAGDAQTIVLRTSPLAVGVTYTLSVNNVRDRATNPNPIAANSQRSFLFDYSPLAVSFLRGAPEPLGPSSRNTPLVISEIMYNPSARPDGRETEFIEIHNAGHTPENIGGFRLAGEVSFTFPPNTTIPAGGFLVVAPVPADIQAVYGIANVVGGFPQRLSNGGGLIRLHNRGNAVLLEVNYSNQLPWPLAADNAGHSLVLARPSYGEDDPRAWTASDLVGGTPGLAETLASNPYVSVVINEILAHTDAPQLDYIELYNYSSQAINLAGCTLSDRPDTNKFVIPQGTSIPARGFVVFNQNQLGFALSTLGETVFFKNPTGNRVLDLARFDAQENGVSIGRYPDGAPSFHELATLTPGTANGPLWIRDVVINEIMFNPISGHDDDEYVELHNRGAAAVNLSSWRFVDGIDFTFPGNTVIPANGYLVVARNAARLMTNYANLNSGNTLGNYQGSLANGGERLALARFAQTLTTNNNVVVTNAIYILADEVHYHDAGQWSRWSDGGGSSLELIDPRSDNRRMANWADSDESAKSQWTLVEHTGVLDHGQGAINELQVLLLGAGECLVDNLEVREASGGNLVANSTFDSGLGGWVIQGNHVNSGLSSPGSGYAGSTHALHLRATSGGDNGANRVETDLTASMNPDNTGTIRARARWLRGHPDLILRLHGNHLEAVGNLAIPRNLGTPGALNSRSRLNVGPAIDGVTHSPVLPAANQPVTVLAQVADPDGLASLVVKYRLDPATNFITIPMVYNGAGLFSATLPGQPAGSLVAFHIQAADGFSPSAVTTFPAEAPVKEALIRFGDPTPPGGFGIYRLWMTQKNINTWSSREKLSNEPLDGTFVYGNRRVIYNAGGRYRGSPWIRPGYNTPTGTRCAYVWTLPEDDLFLGADELNLDSLEPGDRDPTAIREITSFWMADQLGLAFSHQRYVHTVVNGVSNAARGIPVYTDSQQPDSAYMRSWFADDDRGEIFKIDDWFEFNDGVGQEFNIDARLEIYNTTGGVKKQARYRWSWEKKFNRTLNDDYTSLFSLADAMNAPDSTYISQVESTIDVDDWITVFALRHAVGDWDGYGYNRGKNQFTYKPTGGKWRMLLWDLDFSLGCNGGDGPTGDLFSVNDGTIARLYNHPHFRRAYFHAIYRIAYGPFEATNAVPFITAKYNALQANNVATTSPFVGSGAQSISIPDWISQRRTYLINQLASIPATFEITSNSGNNFSTANNYVTLTGNAPISVNTIKVNGVAYPLVWTSLNSWTLRLALGGAVNSLSVQGFDPQGRLVTGAQDSITVTYTGSLQAAQDYLAINEIMYNPVTPGASFIEIVNRSSVNAFDLSNFRLNGVGFTFPEGSIVGPASFLVLAKNVSGFLAAYGNQVPIAGLFPGSLDNGGETLQLLQPGVAPGPDIIIDEVTYDDDPPWPVLADGFGPSLQLIDPAQDNNRVANWTAVSGGGGGGTQDLVGITDVWKYSQSGAEPAGAWKTAGYNDASWPSGAGLLYVENADLPAPKNTALTIGPTTFYFRKSFNFTGNPAGVTLQLNAVIDDGAVFYLNGVEVLRLGMPSDPISYDVFASRVVGDAAFEGPFTLSAASLVQGNNVLAVEVHQANQGSSDVVFGMTLQASSSAGKPYTPGAVNSVGATLPTLPLVWLNELQPNNLTGLQDNFGDRDPWVEVHNSSAATVDLTGFYLSDDYANLNKWAFPAGATLSAGEFRLVWLDNEPGESTGVHLHANFRASPTNGVLVLSKITGGVPTVVDYLNYAPMNNDRSYGAFPDATPAKRQMFYIATPGAPNNATYPPTPVFVNEWMAGNTSFMVDPVDGDFDDWFELYNAGPTAVDLSGFFLTDDLTSTAKWRVPDQTVIPAGGYLLVWADEEGSQNGIGPNLHANFKLSLGGESIGLFAPNGTLIDSVTFGQQTNNISHGRWPDGNSSLYFMTAPSPGQANTLGSAANSAPVLGAIGPRGGPEGALLSFTASATDPDPGQTLTFSLDPVAPAGAEIHPGSGVFTWTPREDQGPGSYVVTIRVTDNGSPPLSDFEALTITVAEVNAAPTLVPIGNRAIEEGALLAFTALGSDGDIPAQSLTYTLEPGAPAGASIDPTTGDFSWRPSETQGPGQYQLTIVVADNGSPSLNAAETITVSVTEVNLAPVLAPVGNRNVDEEKALTFTISATDADLPAQTLTYSMEPGAPAGAAFNPSTRTFTWTPTEEQGPGTYPVTFRVVDNGNPALSHSETINITVAEVNLAPVLAPIGNRNVDEEKALTFTVSATDADLPTQTLTYSLDPGAPAGTAFNPSTRTFTWTPAEEQGPGTYPVTFRVVDNGNPALSHSETIHITVAEVNLAPTLTSVPDQRVAVGTSLTVTNQAADLDLPANQLTFSLAAGAPLGASIDPLTGVFSWQPSSAGTNRVTVIVTDNGAPALTATTAFSIIVSGQSALEITSIQFTPAGEIQLVWAATPGKTYRLLYRNRLSETTWTVGNEYPATGSSVSVVIPASGSSQQYYRVEELP